VVGAGPSREYGNPCNITVEPIDDMFWEIRLGGCPLNAR